MHLTVSFFRAISGDFSCTGLMLQADPSERVDSEGRNDGQGRL